MFFFYAVRDIIAVFWFFKICYFILENNNKRSYIKQGKYIIFINNILWKECINVFKIFKIYLII